MAGLQSDDRRALLNAGLKRSPDRRIIALNCDKLYPYCPKPDRPHSQIVDRPQHRLELIK
ncbi:hypothetical protein QUB60_28900 [Microcoleus sp. A2-C5]|uniref:hypothetical protein n=1 Tax=unclassified Microcoleus TaxID=2642155 RepID=UPI002FCFE195